MPATPEPSAKAGARPTKALEYRQPSPKLPLEQAKEAPRKQAEGPTGPEIALVTLFFDCKHVNYPGKTGDYETPRIL